MTYYKFYPAPAGILKLYLSKILFIFPVLLMAPCYSKKTDVSNELTFMQFDDAILESIHFQFGAILKKMPTKIPYLYYYSMRYLY